MQSSRDESIRLAWATTQENLENAVGSAYSRWNRLNAGYVQPAFESIGSCFLSCFGRSNYMSRNNRRGSMDFFFDMYDDGDAFGRDELERLLNEEDHGDYDSEPFITGDVPGGSSSGGGRLGLGSNLKDLSSNDNGGGVAAKLMSWIPPFFRWTDPTLHYKPSTAGLTGVSTNRTRSSTKSSSLSTETYRSRGELFSDGEYDGDQMEDAQMVSDNFAASLIFTKQRSNGSSTNISSTGSYYPSSTSEDERNGLKHNESESSLIRRSSGRGSRVDVCQDGQIKDNIEDDPIKSNIEEDSGEDGNDSDDDNNVQEDNDDNSNDDNRKGNDDNISQKSINVVEVHAKNIIGDLSNTEDDTFQEFQQYDPNEDQTNQDEDSRSH